MFADTVIVFVVVNCKVVDGGDYAGEDTLPASCEQVIGYVLLDTDGGDHIHSLPAIERVDGLRRHLSGYEPLR